MFHHSIKVKLLLQKCHFKTYFSRCRHHCLRHQTPNNTLQEYRPIFYSNHLIIHYSNTDLFSIPNVCLGGLGDVLESFDPICHKFTEYFLFVIKEVIWDDVTWSGAGDSWGQAADCVSVRLRSGRALEVQGADTGNNCWVIHILPLLEIVGFLPF